MKFRLWLILAVLFWPLLTGTGAPASEPTCARPDRHVSAPLTELGGSTYVRMDGQATTFIGGLYPGGRNERPPMHAAAGLALAQQVTPLDRQGLPDPRAGKIVFISIGMSNTSMEFGAFTDLVQRDREVNRRVTLVNAAQPNRTAERWVDPQDEPWLETLRRLEQRSLSPEQVQIAWVKQVERGGGAFPEKAQALERDLEAIARNLHTHFPNLKIAFFSSRTRSYTYERGLSPEPLAFESGFAVKWLIEKQINGDPALNHDPARGEVVAPFITWGPYLWADGMTPRQDGLMWAAADMRPDCTHPSPAGAAKVAGLLLDFFKADTLARGWFLAAPAQSIPAITPTPVVSPFPPPTATRVTPVATPLPDRTLPAAPAVTATAAVVQQASPIPTQILAGQTPSALPERSPAPADLIFVGLLVLALGAGGLLLLRRRN